MIIYLIPLYSCSGYIVSADNANCLCGLFIFNVIIAIVVIVTFSTMNIIGYCLQ